MSFVHTETHMLIRRRKSLSKLMALIGIQQRRNTIPMHHRSFLVLVIRTVSWGKCSNEILDYSDIWCKLRNSWKFHKVVLNSICLRLKSWKPHFHLISNQAHLFPSFGFLRPNCLALTLIQFPVPMKKLWCNTWYSALFVYSSLGCGTQDTFFIRRALACPWELMKVSMNNVDADMPKWFIRHCYWIRS